jgi:hypothetical protein
VINTAGRLGVAGAFVAGPEKIEFLRGHARSSFEGAAAAGRGARREPAVIGDSLRRAASVAVPYLRARLADVIEVPGATSASRRSSIVRAKSAPRSPARCSAKADVRAIGRRVPSGPRACASRSPPRCSRTFSTASRLSRRRAQGDRPLPRIPFVTGTDTGVGKTGPALPYALHGVRRVLPDTPSDPVYWKPIQTGSRDDDTATVRRWAVKTANCWTWGWDAAPLLPHHPPSWLATAGHDRAVRR